MKLTMRIPLKVVRLLVCVCGSRGYMSHRFTGTQSWVLPETLNLNSSCLQVRDDGGRVHTRRIGGVYQPQLWYFRLDFTHITSRH